MSLMLNYKIDLILLSVKENKHKEEVIAKEPVEAAAFVMQQEMPCLCDVTELKKVCFEIVSGLDLHPHELLWRLHEQQWMFCFEFRTPERKRFDEVRTALEQSELWKAA